MERPQNEELSDPASFSSSGLVYEKALANQPQIAADQFRLKSAEKSIAIAKSAFLPSVSLFGTLSTNFSTEGKQLQSVETIQTSQNGFINGAPVLLELEQNVPQLMDAPYKTQLQDNFGQGLGVNINIPIYSKGKNKISVEKAKINLLKTRAIAHQNKQQLKMEVLKAYTDMQSAWQAYLAAEKSLDAAQRAFQDVSERFELGMASAYELNNARNNEAIAQFDLSQSKFQYLFFKKVVEFYKGTIN